MEKRSSQREGCHLSVFPPHSRPFRRLEGLIRPPPGADCGAIRHAVAKIAAQDLQRHALELDFPRRAEAGPAQKRQRWTPALYGMLKEEARDEGRKSQPAAVGPC